ncbi:ATP phosphoribosyltransferase regulatory subunit [Acidovorax sp. 93]|jgi:ATP phosphoribosyltransferase regulatory subunit|uniref:ATP phosphoribosyltransferase regulatory subunit n=1 Tax=Acidovorax TaxID=12916 RepID=UPI0008B491BD|nr:MULTISPECIES: ATP phosphoribosyltransferase regulatory subunit [unclassified Acidovorax]OGA84136.1 MAG: ATP phosphoribosyltransferase regulatory subunit [Burkholderiales bacterium GWA2_64_37]HCE91476.1 ATP phosphoribosyltransferase regulatory subunit [Acidovorax sp.]MBV7462863.1 ATP phosphoribosyltransferase regulatory subunit [Acidovorax sp. sif0632]MBV7467889.1 ATP phosphoribosyltransferase regulatory subunit [Acidovorax sp. sif0613]RKR25480.1 ATP phosphoribosyltransferase regulatory subu
MSAWVLPDHIADVLPSEARHIEELRRGLLDTARCYGYELVMPPLLEHLESLLTGTGEALDLQTFKLVDQLSGRSMGLRADTTPQVARIDAHLLNRKGVTRLCYCGPVLHTRPDRPHATREPLQFGAEIFGHAGLEADLEALQLARECLRIANVPSTTIDLADVRIVRNLLAGVSVNAQVLSGIHAALAAKDAAELAALTRDFPVESREGLLALLQLYGDQGVLIEAKKAFQRFPGISQVLSNLNWLASRLEGAAVTFDLADLRGYAYYSGARFAIYAPGASDALVRGGRYDEVGAVFGRNRPAAGFSLDIKQVVGVVSPRALKAAIRAPWGESDEVNAAIAELRTSGETVVCVLPGHESEVDEFHCDRELVQIAGRWVVQAV